MKKIRKFFSSNKGNATYYVMVIIIVITIMVSGLLAVSLRSSVVSTNYVSDIESYNKCESVLQKIKGELKVALVGERIKDPAIVPNEADIEGWFVATGSKASNIIATSGLSQNDCYYYPVITDGETRYKAENYLTSAELSVLDCTEFVAEKCYGFEIVESEDKTYVSIKNIIAKDGGVGISTDIKLVLDNSCRVYDVVFENYKMLTVTDEVSTTPVDTAEGGGQ